MHGIHFALSAKDLSRLRKLEDPGEILDFIAEELEERYLENDKWSFQSEQAWDLLHRCLTGDPSLPKPRAAALAQAILGGVEIEADSEVNPRLVEPEQVLDTAIALEAVEQDWFEQRHEELDDTISEGEVGAGDLEDAWSAFEGLRAFFDRAAKAGRAVLFVAS